MAIGGGSSRRACGGLRSNWLRNKQTLSLEFDFDRAWNHANESKDRAELDLLTFVATPTTFRPTEAANKIA
jgi:hypothetical protein